MEKQYFSFAQGEPLNEAKILLEQLKRMVCMVHYEGEERSHVNVNSLHSQTSAEDACEPNQFDLLCDNVNTSMIMLNNSLQEVGH